MLYPLLQVDCTDMCVGSACTQPSYNDKNPSSVFFLSPNMFSPVSNQAVRLVTSQDRSLLPRLFD